MSHFAEISLILTTILSGDIIATINFGVLMIINFVIKNCACFKAETCLSMQAGPERDLDSKLAIFGEKSRPSKLLPMAAIYGNNATGKTQFVKAVEFIRNFVLGRYNRGVLPVVPFLFDETTKELPTYFSIQFLMHDIVYEYEVELSAESVFVEKLSFYTSRGLVRHQLFNRTKQRVEVFPDWGDEAFITYSKTLKLRPNISFLALSCELTRTSEHVKNVHVWFAHNLCIITPDTHYNGFEDFCPNGVMHKKTLEYLEEFDNGIKNFKQVSVSPTILPDAIRIEIESSLKPGRTARYNSPEGDLFFVNRLRNGDLNVTRVFTVHNGGRGRDVSLRMSAESDGTRRMLDLIPAFSNFAGGNCECVYVVDELDRSLHSSITIKFLKDFLLACSSNTRQQMIFTTHDLLTMDQKLLRRDSMYIADKTMDGVASLTDIRQFRGLRKDTNVRDRYLEGRFGGIARALV